MRPEPDPGEIGDDNDDEPLHHYVDGNATELISILLKSACAGFDTGRAANRKHSDKRVFEHQTAMSLQHRSGTQAAYRTFNKFRSDALHNDTHTRAIKKLADPEDKQHSLTAYETGGDTRPLWRRRTDIINTQFADAVNNLMNTAEPAGLFSDPVIAAIDVTTVEVDYTLWKDEDEIEDDDRRVVVNSKTGETKVPRDDISPLLRGKMDEDNYGTELHYATLTAVAGNMPVILGAFPIRHDSFWEEDGTTIPYAEVVDELMAQATQITDIDLVMADRAFDSHAVFHVLDQYWNVDYLIPKKADSDDINADLARVKNNPEVISSVVEQSLFLRSDVPYIDREDDPTVDDDYHSHDMMFAYVPAENEEWAALEIDDTPYAVFATNRVMGPSLALDLTKKYSHRWDIENEYRMTLPFLPAIASRDDRMRYFAFVFSCLLYNVWRVVDHSLKTLAKERYDDYELEDDETRLDPVLPFSDMVLTAIVMLFSRDGLDPPDPPL